MTPDELESAASTVHDIAAHMDRMRGSARDFHTHFPTGERGYFTPSEDDEVQHLWVSYHMARNALLELIQSLRADVGSVSTETLREFLVGYAAAVVLIDAARFLRDLFGPDEIVRRKLNESFDLYGIAAGSFDSIQMSLTNPQNALQIHEANKFFDEHLNAIRSFASEQPKLQSLLAVIDAMGDRTRVSKTDYVKAGLAEHQRQLRDYIVEGGLRKTVYAIQEWASRFVSSLTTMPGHVPQLPDNVATAMTAQLRAGDVFVTRKESAVTNYFLPGYWPHAAMYVGEHRVIESLKDGVRERGLDSPFGNDAVALIRPIAEPSEIEKSVQRARSHVGKPYDFDFDFTRSDRMVCTEVVYRSYEGLGGMSFSLSRRAGRMTLSAEDLLQLALRCEHFHIQAVYCPLHCEDLIVDERMGDVLRATMAPAN